MKFVKKELVIFIIVFSILISSVNAVDMCLYPNLPDMPCEGIGDGENVADDAQCEDTGGIVSSDNELCQIGCCCSLNSVDKVYAQYAVITKAYCNSLSNPVFKGGDKSFDGCKKYCVDLTNVYKKSGKLPACSNGVDDDQDGLFDYPKDKDCVGLEDDSEMQTLEKLECMDGIDNDGDGKIDFFGFYENWFYAPNYYNKDDAEQKKQYYNNLLNPADTTKKIVNPDDCCTKSYGVSESCEFDECSVDKQNDELCKCGNNVCGFPNTIPDYTVSYTGTKPSYFTGKYCCNGKCSQEPCAACVENEITYEIKADGKHKYQCSNSQLVEIGVEPIGSIEVCLDPAEIDQDKDNKQNCVDPDCFSLKCSNLKASAAAPDGCRPVGFNGYYSQNPSLNIYDVSYLDEVDDLWKCCFPETNSNGDIIKSNVNDCKYNDGIPDTCGQCKCVSLHMPAQELKLNHDYGKPRINISFYFGCQENNIELNIMRCEGTPGNCGADSQSMITLETSFKFTDITDQVQCIVYSKDSDTIIQMPCFGKDGVVQPGANLNPNYEVIGIYDTKIEGSNSNNNLKHYSYVIKSTYPDKEVSFSTIEHIASGHNICLSHTGDFCLRGEGMGVGSESLKYYCDENNLLQSDECDGYGDSWPDTICIEKKENGKVTTGCISNTPCIFCGQPFNMYGSLGKDGSMLGVPKGFMDYNVVDSEMDCSKNAICNYDFTNTVKDAYGYCKNIGSCSDYKSKTACEQYALDEDDLTPNNKCLAQNCMWKSSYDNKLTDEIEKGSLDIGLCINEVENYKTCDMCNKMSANSVFASCTKDICYESFSTENTKCYINYLNKKCVEQHELTCTNYKDNEKDCHANGYKGTGDAWDVEVDAWYLTSGGTKRIWGTNKLKWKSNDILGLGVCRWNPLSDNCIKDADGDGKHDGGTALGKKAIDIIPPVTEVIVPANVDEIRLKFAVTDPTPYGRPSSGELKTYYCFPEDKLLSESIISHPNNQNYGFSAETTELTVNYEGYKGYCYPNILFKPEDGLDYISIPKENGKQTMFFYSTDGAKNLEEVKSFIFNVDKKPPEIKITPYITYDKSKPYDDSSILFAVELDEIAKECYDIFEGYDGIKKINYEQGQYFQSNYNGLTDGTYYYTVVCTDMLDNKINKTTFVTIDADQEIQASLPMGKIDYSPIKLEIKTLHKGDCRYGTSDSFELLTSFDTETDDNTNGKFKKYSTQSSLAEDGLYEFKVMCKFPALSNELHKDEIQFVYDITPPVTSLTSGSGVPFDYSKWYNKDEAGDSVFLECNDEPEFGFGCENTIYCLQSGAAKCDLSFGNQQVIGQSGVGQQGTVIDPYISVKVESSASSQWLCYQSKENIYNSLGTDYGGNQEQKKCIKLLIDSDNGPVIDVPLLKPHSDPLNPYIYYTTLFNLKGAVIDSDSEVSPPANNKLDINVYGLSAEALQKLQAATGATGTSGTKTTGTNGADSGDGTIELEFEPIQSFENIDANNDFFQELELSSGYNKIVLTAKDRSGKDSAVYEYYIAISTFEGELLNVISPIKGVSDVEEFDLIIETAKELPPADTCKLSTNPLVGYTSQLEKLSGRQFKKHINFPGMAEETYYTVFIKCDFPGGLFDIKEVELIWDVTPPSLEKVFIEPSDRKSPPNIVEHPLITNLTIVTDDKSRCKYSTVNTDSYFSMTPFDGYENLSFVNEQPLTNLFDGYSYTYYVMCDNGPTEPASNHISEKANFTFNVNTSMFTGFTLVKPETYLGYNTVSFELHTTKQAANCEFGPSKELIEQYVMNTVSEGVDRYKIHTAGPLQLSEGKHDFYFRCLTAAEGWIEDHFIFYIDLSPPDIQVKTQPYTNSLTTLTASWEAEDDEGIMVSLYNFSIGTAAGLDDIYEWSSTDDHKKTIKNLNLNNETTYWWNVIAQNSVGLWSVVASNSTYVDPNYNPGEEILIDEEIDLCKNDVKDNDETDIDCGGSCQECSNGKNCNLVSDCMSGQCELGICISAGCDDGIINQLETDIDCGGYCAACADDMNCNINSDCISGYCKAGLCTLPTCNDGVQNGQELGADCGGQCPKECELKPGEESTASCDDGIKNQGEEGIDCGGPCSSCEKPPTTEEPKKDDNKEGGTSLFVWLILILLIAGLGGCGYYYYINYFLKEKPLFPNKNMHQQMPKTIQSIQQQRPVIKGMQQPKPMQRSMQNSMINNMNALFRPLSRDVRQKKTSGKLKQRLEMFNAFDERSKLSNDIKLQPKETEKEVKAGKIRINAAKEQRKEEMNEKRKEELTKEIKAETKAQKLEIASAFKAKTDKETETDFRVAPKILSTTPTAKQSVKSTTKSSVKSLVKPIPKNKPDKTEKITVKSVGFNKNKSSDKLKPDSALDKLSSKLKKGSINTLDKLGVKSKSRDALKKLAKFKNKNR
ncbi:MAG: hypothetical protein ABIG89_04415 [Candidatus Woesearchaeota archaeon]